MAVSMAELGGRGGSTACTIRKGTLWSMWIFSSSVMFLLFFFFPLCPCIQKSLKSNAGNCARHSSSWCKWTSSNLGRSEHPEPSLAPTCVNSTAKGSYSPHSEPSFCLCDRWQLSTSFKNDNSEGLGNIYRKSILIALLESGASGFTFTRTTTKFPKLKLPQSHFVWI